MTAASRRSPASIRGILASLRAKFETALSQHPLLATLYALIQHSMIYLAGAVVLGLGNFVLVPLYTRHLTPADFGAYALIEISLLITVTTTQMGLGTTYLRWYAETEVSRRGEILATSLTAGFAAAIVGGLLLAAIVGGPLGNKWLPGSARVAWILFPVVLLRTGQSIFLSSLQAAQRPVAYVVSAMMRLLALVVAGYWFVALHGEGVRGVMRGWLVGDGACLLVLLAFCLPGMRLRARLDLLWPMLRYGFPLVWSALMALLLDASGRYFLAQYQSLADVGRYSVGIKITSILSVGFLQPFSNAWAGAAFPIAHRPNAPLTYTKIMGYALIVATLFAAITILFGPLLVRVFAGSAYINVASLLPWLLLPIVCRVLEYWSSLPLYLKYKTHWLGPLATAEAALCVLLNRALVPRLGALGAAVAWSTALAAGIVAMALLGRRYYPLPLDLRTCTFAAGLWIFAAAGSRLTSAFGGQLQIEAPLLASAFLIVTCMVYFLWDIRNSRALFKTEAYAAD